MEHKNKHMIVENASFWQNKYGPYEANAPLPAGEHSADVVIIGGGFTGLTVAREIKRDDPSQKVMVLEALEVGFGASGRNGGFNMSLFGLEPETTIWRWGMERTRAAQHYMSQAVSYVRDLIESEGLASHYEHNGMWRVAYSEAQEKRLRKTYALLQNVGNPEHYQYIEGQALQSALHAPKMRAAIIDRHSGILDPCRHVRELKRLAVEAGAQVYEHSAMTHFSLSPNGVKIATKTGHVRAKRLVLATNAWTHTLSGPGRPSNRQRPVGTYQIVTEPLTQADWQAIGWEPRMSIEDNRQLVHYMRVTQCGRITLGGGDIYTERSKSMQHWRNPTIWQKLESHFRWLFPQLSHLKFSYQWGGAVSVNLDMVPEIGYLHDERIIYATGCMGHGVSLTQLNGRLIADLLLKKDSELSRFWIVNRRAIPLPPGDTIPYLGMKAIVGALKIWDRIEERSLE